MHSSISPTPRSSKFRNFRASFSIQQVKDIRVYSAAENAYFPEVRNPEVHQSLKNSISNNIFPEPQPSGCLRSLEVAALSLRECKTDQVRRI